MVVPFDFINNYITNKFVNIKIVGKTDILFCVHM